LYDCHLIDAEYNNLTFYRKKEMHEKAMFSKLYNLITSGLFEQENYICYQIVDLHDLITCRKKYYICYQTIDLHDFDCNTA